MSLPYEQVIADRVAAADWALSAGLIRPDTHALAVQVLAVMKRNQSPVCALTLGQMSTIGYARPGRPPDLPLSLHFAWVEHDPYAHRNAYAAALAQVQNSGIVVNDFNADRADAIGEFDAHFTAVPGVRAGREWNCTTMMHFRLWPEEQHETMLAEYILTHHIDFVSRVSATDIQKF